MLQTYFNFDPGQFHTAVLTNCPDVDVYIVASDSVTNRFKVTILDLESFVEESQCGSSMLDTTTAFDVPNERTIVHDFIYGHWTSRMDHELSVIYGKIDSRSLKPCLKPV